MAARRTAPRLRGIIAAPLEQVANAGDGVLVRQHEVLVRIRDVQVGGAAAPGVQDGVAVQHRLPAFDVRRARALSHVGPWLQHEMSCPHRCHHLLVRIEASQVCDLRRMRVSVAWCMSCHSSLCPCSQPYRLPICCRTCLYVHVLCHAWHPATVEVDMHIRHLVYGQSAPDLVNISNGGHACLLQSKADSMSHQHCNKKCYPCNKPPCVTEPSFQHSPRNTTERRGHLGGGARLRVLHDLRKAYADVVIHEVHQHAVDICLRRRVQEGMQHGRNAHAGRILRRSGPRQRLQDHLACLQRTASA